MKRKLVVVGQGLALAVVALVSASVFQAVPAAQAAVSYDREAARAYAVKYACNGNESCRNPSYDNFGATDCTNFVSQAMRAGGIPFKRTGAAEDQWWWDGKGTLFDTNRSRSWSSVSAMRTYLLNTDRARVTNPDMEAYYNYSQVGDLYTYDWGEGEGWSHLSMATGSGAFAKYGDYGSITTGAGSRMTQHSNDRDGAPWNYGYQTQRNPSIKAKMRTQIMKINT